MKYCIFDPTGNITALVETEVEPPLQPAAAAEIMRRHPGTEQVGFLSDPEPGEKDIHAVLRMAGGEFCGNASMCAAALTELRRLQAGGTKREEADVRLRVSGAAAPVEVHLRAEGDKRWWGCVRMPQALGIERIPLAFGEDRAELTLVRMQGISHLVIEEDSPFFRMKDQRPEAEEAVRSWCGELKAEGLGLMFPERNGREYRLTPLVYIPGSHTLFWEQSCASGSSAVGMALAADEGRPVHLMLVQPGGCLTVKSDPETRETLLYGTIKLTAEFDR